MINIPIQLRNEQFKFIRVSKHDSDSPSPGKRPIGKDWNTTNNDLYNSERLLSWDGNYGVVCGVGGLIVIDCDTEALNEAVKSTLSETFTVKTGKGHHYYYICPEVDKKIVIEDGNQHHGEVQSVGSMVVGPGSTHVNGNVYSISCDKPIDSIGKDDLNIILDVFNIKKKRNLIINNLNKKNKDSINNSKELANLTPLYKIKINDFIKGDGNMPHPYHSSETGYNFSINENLSHCWRHNVSLNPIQLLAIKSGKVKCQDAGFKHLDGSCNENYEKLITLAFNQAIKDELIPEATEYPRKAIEYLTRSNQKVEITTDNKVILTNDTDNQTEKDSGLKNKKSYIENDKSSLLVLISLLKRIESKTTKTTKTIKTTLQLEKTAIKTAINMPDNVCSLKGFSPTNDNAPLPAENSLFEMDDFYTENDGDSYSKIALLEKVYEIDYLFKTKGVNTTEQQQIFRAIFYIFDVYLRKNSQKTTFSLLVSSLLSTDELAKMLNISKDLARKTLFRTQKGKKSGLLEEGKVKMVKVDTNQIKYYGLTDEGYREIYNTLTKIDEELDEKLTKQLKLEDNSNVKEAISKYLKFIESQLSEEIRTESESVVIDYNDLIKFNKYFKVWLKNLDITIEIFNNTLKDFLYDLNYINNKKDNSPKIRIINFPDDYYINVGSIRTKHEDKVIMVEGTIIQKTPVTPEATVIKFECPACGLITNEIVTEDYIEPKGCRCGKRGKLINLKTESMNFQILKIEELGEELNSRTSQEHINIILKEDLCKPALQIYYNTGQRITITGTVKTYKPAKGRKFDRIWVVEAHSIKPSKLIEDINITNDDFVEFQDFVKKDNFKQLLLDSIFPSIQHLEEEKLGLLLSAVGSSVSKNKRPQLHLLLIGEPATGKSTLIEDLHKVIPNSRFASGTGTSDRGLGASVVKDELTGSWALCAGILPLSHNGIAIIDEIDKMEDTTVLHDAMERQVVSVNRATIKAELPCKVSIIASGNPVTEFFNREKSPYSQINLKKAIITRFDLIFILYDEAQNDKDVLEAGRMIDNYIGNVEEIETLSLDFLKKYIWFSKNKINPKLSKEVKKALISSYIVLRGKYNTTRNSEVICSKRHQVTLMRLSMSYAKLRLDNVVTVEDVKIAEGIVDKMLGDLTGNLEKKEYNVSFKKK